MPIQIFDNPTDNINLNALIDRKRGEYFAVKDNKLERVQGCGNRFRYWKDAGWKQTAQTVAALMQKLNEKITSVGAYSAEWTRMRNELRPHFDKNGAIGRLSSYIFSRESFQGSDLDLMMMEDRTARVKITLSGRDYYIYTQHSYTGLGDPYHLHLDLGTDRLNHNLLMLLTRERGVRFQTTSDDPRVARLERVDGVKKRLSYCWNRTERQQAVKKVVEEVVRGIGGLDLDDRTVGVLSHCLQNQGAFTHLSERVFDRGCIEEGSALEKALFPKLGEAREAFQRADRDDRDQYEESFKNYSYFEFLFAQSLGVGLKAVSRGGSGGARFGYSRYGTAHSPIWVLKPSDEGPNGAMNPSTFQRVKSFFISQRTSLQDNSDACSEVDAATTDRALKTHIVPPTMREHVASGTFYGKNVKECSLQMFVEGAKTLSEHLEIPCFMHFLPRSFLRWYYGRETKRKEFAEKLPVELMERLAAHNFLNEDFDCHLDNVLILNNHLPVQGRGGGFFHSGENQKVLRSLFFSINGVTLIKHDNGSSNPHSHPEFSLLHPIETYLSQRYRYFFEVLPVCENVFSADFSSALQGNRDSWNQALKAKVKQAMHSMIHPLKIFEAFWRERQAAVEAWLETGEGKAALVQDLAARSNQELAPQYQNSPEILRYFSYHLDRIRNALIARQESFAVLMHHLEHRSTDSMRTLLTETRYKADFVARFKEMDASDG